MYHRLQLALSMAHDISGNSGKVTMAAGDNIAGTVNNESETTFRVNGTNGAASTTRKLQFYYTAISRA